MKRIQCEVYSRVVGYFRPIYTNWNPGKIQEHKDRVFFKVEGNMTKACAWCGRPMGEVEPKEVTGTTHGMCESCEKIMNDMDRVPSLDFSA